MESAPPYNVSHFAINVDDIDRAMRFYSTVFGWSFTPWGPPGFFMIDTGGGGIHGSMQQRSEPLGCKMAAVNGFECTIAVHDVDETVGKIESHGGTIRYPKTTIPTVGDVATFYDPEGNYVGIARYDASAR